MSNIITLTVNPVVDKNTVVNDLIPNVKLQCTSPIYFAGGGGINVSRAIGNLGGTSLAIYLAGGPTGTHLESLLKNEGVPQEVIGIQGCTRENLAVRNSITDLEYRFGVPGPYVLEKEWQESLIRLENFLQEGDYLVASGKLSPGIPEDFFVKVATIVKKKKAKLILDTKGEALKQAVTSNIFLFKPNLAELSALCGIPFISFAELETLAKGFLEKHPCTVMVVSLGEKGALLVTKDLLEYIPAPIVQQKSMIGAGDSMVAGMVLSVLEGKSFKEMVEYGVACGTAATMHPGTQLCKKEDVDMLIEQLN
ncbi:6-phosphofructokinase 2 [Saonia flava]|uniref:6-phosphofructokinase 2 n=1 Tax=Saonia flava TaxID=523696 RepID=A0A846QZ34_9FLAO|nr:1-phosphofructokinase family hexose kinase [Saonia flava]NJB70394.1 6-phosphofructokinase 2 [Saonia flava]